jgi:isopenicillin N synthase-like dioxygenase
MLNGHTDFNSISTLVSQPISALQILMPDGVWRYVKHKDDALVINIGDQLSWVNSHWSLHSGCDDNLMLGSCRVVS